MTAPGTPGAERAATPVAPAKTFTLHFTQLGRSITTRADESIFQSARRGGVRIVGACGGRGTCGSCVVRVTEGQFERLNADDKLEGRRSHKKWYRACQIRAQSDCTLEVAPRSLAPVVRAETDDPSELEILPLAPAVESIDVTVAAATLADPRSDLDRVRQAMGRPTARVDTMAVRALSRVLRADGWHLRVRARGEEIIDFGARGSRTLGLAVDLGTTNVGGFLIDLETGLRIASLGIENPQAMWGADLISRINYAIRDAEAAEDLRSAAVAAVNALATDLCQAVGVSCGDIVDVAICGNTAMHHLLLGLPVRQLGRAPFVAAARATTDVRARDLGLSVAVGAYVQLAPSIGGFVGGDHVTALLATEDRWSGVRTALVMDIGTNTEISVIHDGKILSASCPSGPALEGGHISCGMRAADGAIERVRLEDGRIAVQTIGRDKPIGLCGSGVLDAVSTLLQAGISDIHGRIRVGHPDVTDAGGVKRAILAPGVEFTQGDLRSVQLAKSAIRTGVELLLDEAGLTELAIDRFIIAGSFGAYINVASGIATGLFPNLPRERFEQVGNAAGLGVRRMLASQLACRRADEIAAGSRYVELSTRPDFQKQFLHHIGFDPRATAQAPGDA